MSIGWDGESEAIVSSTCVMTLMKSSAPVVMGPYVVSKSSTNTKVNVSRSLRWNRRFKNDWARWTLAGLEEMDCRSIATTVRPAVDSCACAGGANPASPNRAAVAASTVNISNLRMLLLPQASDT